MKKNRVKEEFLRQLKLVPIVQVACERVGISRNSIYRWRREDKEFEEAWDSALAEGEALVNDMTESQLLTLIKEKSWSAISFWLRHRNPRYRDKLEVTTKRADDVLSAEQELIVREALKLATIQTINPNTLNHDN